MSTEKPHELAKPDPGKALAGLTGALEKLGGIDGALGKMDASDARSDLISIKLTILLENLEVPWESDPRIAKWEERHKTRLKRSK